jgi:hypothetical protein
MPKEEQRRKWKAQKEGEQMRKNTKTERENTERENRRNGGN